jgi:hypothetical protein
MSTLTNKSKYTEVRVQLNENPEYSYVQNTNTIKYKPEYTQVQVQLSEKTRTPSISTLVVKPPVHLSTFTSKWKLEYNYVQIPSRTILVLEVQKILKPINT